MRSRIIAKAHRATDLDLGDMKLKYIRLTRRKKTWTTPGKTRYRKGGFRCFNWNEAKADQVGVPV